MLPPPFFFQQFASNLHLISDRRLDPPLLTHFLVACWGRLKRLHSHYLVGVLNLDRHRDHHILLFFLTWYDLGLWRLITIAVIVVFVLVTFFIVAVAAQIIKRVYSLIRVFFRFRL